MTPTRDDILTPETRAELERLCAEAPPGPWAWRPHDYSLFSYTSGHQIAEFSRHNQVQSIAAANFIIAAREWLPHLLAMIPPHTQPVADSNAILDWMAQGRFTERAIGGILGMTADNASPASDESSSGRAPAGPLPESEEVEALCERLVDQYTMYVAGDGEWFPSVMCEAADMLRLLTAALVAAQAERDRAVAEERERCVKLRVVMPDDEYTRNQNISYPSGFAAGVNTYRAAIRARKEGQ